MLANKYIEKFIHILESLIFAPQLGCCYIDIKDLLDKAKNIKDMKKDIIVNFPKQEKFVILRSNQRSKRLTKRSARLVKLAARSTDTKKSSTGANLDHIYPKSKFKPMSTKPKRWIEAWYKLQAFFKKLTNKKQIAIAKK